MPKHVLHVAPASAPCRAVLLHHALLGNAVPALDLHAIDLQAGQHKTPEYLAMNPRHCVPTLETPYGALCESRAIMIYFADLAQQKDPQAWTLYPRTLYQRARVHELLDWDQGSFYKAVGGVVYPQVFEKKAVGSAELDVLEGVLHYLDDHVLGHGGTFLTGDKPTIADISIAMGATMLDLCGMAIPQGLHRVPAWLYTMTRFAGWAEVNAPFRAWVEAERAAATPAIAPTIPVAAPVAAPPAAE